MSRIDLLLLEKRSLGLYHAYNSKLSVLFLSDTLTYEQLIQRLLTDSYEAREIMRCVKH
jgi:hypothetical protein